MLVTTLYWTISSRAWPSEIPDSSRRYQQVLIHTVGFVHAQPQLHPSKEHTCSLLLMTTSQLESARSFMAITLTHHTPRVELAFVCLEAEQVSRSQLRLSLEIWLHSLPVVLKDWIDLIEMLPNM